MRYYFAFLVVIFGGTCAISHENLLLFTHDNSKICGQFFEFSGRQRIPNFGNVSTLLANRNYSGFMELAADMKERRIFWVTKINSRYQILFGQLTPLADESPPKIVEKGVVYASTDSTEIQNLQFDWINKLLFWVEILKMNAVEEHSIKYCHLQQLPDFTNHSIFDAENSVCSNSSVRTLYRNRQDKISATTVDPLTRSVYVGHEANTGILRFSLNSNYTRVTDSTKFDGEEYKSPKAIFFDCVQENRLFWVNSKFLNSTHDMYTHSRVHNVYKPHKITAIEHKEVVWMTALRDYIILLSDYKMSVFPYCSDEECDRRVVESKPVGENRDSFVTGRLIFNQQLQPELPASCSLEEAASCTPTDFVRYRCTSELLIDLDNGGFPWLLLLLGLSTLLSAVLVTVVVCYTRIQFTRKQIILTQLKNTIPIYLPQKFM